MVSYTSRYGLGKPDVNNADDQDIWGEELNANQTILDIALDSYTSVITSGYAVSSTDRNKFFLCSSSAGAAAISLANPSSALNGFRIRLKKTDNTANAITVSPYAAELIEGSTSDTLTTQYQTTEYITDGTNWFKAAIAPTKQPTYSYLTTGTGATYNVKAGCKALQVEIVGAGGGGGAVLTNAGSNGGDTIFNSIHAAGGGGGGAYGTAGKGGTGGAGGTGSADLRIPGADGCNTPIVLSSAVISGGNGGNSFFGGAGRGGFNAEAGQAGKTNSGSGGGGASGTGSGAHGGAGGGGAGEYVLLYMTSLAATYTYTIGASGDGGAAGDSAGGAGAAGLIKVTEYY